MNQASKENKKLTWIKWHVQIKHFISRNSSYIAYSYVYVADNHFDETMKQINYLYMNTHYRR